MSTVAWVVNMRIGGALTRFLAPERDSTGSLGTLDVSLDGSPNASGHEA